MDPYELEFAIKGKDTYKDESSRAIILGSKLLFILNEYRHVAARCGHILAYEDIDPEILEEAKKFRKVPLIRDCLDSLVNGTVTPPIPSGPEEDIRFQFSNGD